MLRPCLLLALLHQRNFLLVFGELTVTFSIYWTVVLVILWHYQWDSQVLGKHCIYTGSIPAVDRIYRGTRARQGCCFPAAESWKTTITDAGTFKSSDTHTVPQVPDSTMLPWSVSQIPVILVKWTKQKNFTDEGNSPCKKVDQRLLTLLGLGEQKFGTYRDYAFGKC